MSTFTHPMLIGMLQTAIAHHNSGNLPEAERIYREALRLDPVNADALHLLGLACYQSGRYAEAIDHIGRAIRANGKVAIFHNNIGEACRALGRLDEAAGHYQRALKLNPHLPDAANNLGLLHQQKGDYQRASHYYRQALAAAPGFVPSLLNLGRCQHETGDYAEAVKTLRKAVAADPGNSKARLALAEALREDERLEEALAVNDRLVAENPGLAEAWVSRGQALEKARRFDEALASFRRALELVPGNPNVLNNIGVALQALDRHEEAQDYLRRALEIKPDFAEAHNNLGHILRDINQLDGAEACYRQALEIDPNRLEALGSLLFLQNYFDGSAPSGYLGQARQYGRIVAAKAGERFSAWQSAARPKRLRVGLVSGDLRSHSVGFFLEGLLSQIDPARIELIAYPTNHQEDVLTARIRPYFAAWKPLVGLSDGAAARLIHADGVHVLIDTSGHTAHNRLPVFAWKPAPVQITWLGLPNTTGVGEMDYVLGDLQSIPAEHENHFSETVWRLPDSYLCFSEPAYPVKVAPLPAFAAGYVTFGSFNNLTKMNDAVVELWARILMAVPDSRLYLKSAQLKNADVCAQTLRRFAARGIAPERLLLCGMLASRDDHLAAYNKVDIALDTFPYPGVTTSVEALWMGVPVVTLQGDRFLSLSAKSIAYHAGSLDWVAADKDDYVSKAVAFASDLESLASQRAGLRQQVLASPLFDAQRFARNFENALWEMWETHQTRPQKPESTSHWRGD